MYVTSQTNAKRILGGSSGLSNLYFEQVSNKKGSRKEVECIVYAHVPDQLRNKLDTKETNVSLLVIVQMQRPISCII